MIAKLSLVSVFLIFTTAANAGVLPSPMVSNNVGASIDDSFDDTIDWVDDSPKNKIEIIDEHRRFVKNSIQEHPDDKNPVDDDSAPLGYLTDNSQEEVVAAFNLTISDKVESLVGYPQDISSEEEEESPVAYAKSSMIYNEESVAPAIDFFAGNLANGNPQNKMEIVSLKLLLKELLELRDGLIHNESK